MKWSSESIKFTYPHRAHLRSMLLGNIAAARSIAEQNGGYDRRQLDRYCEDMQLQVDRLDSMPDYPEDE